MLNVIEESGGWLLENAVAKVTPEVSFCQGTSGVIPLLTLAAEVFQTDLRARCLQAAHLAGELTWQQGRIGVIAGTSLSHCGFSLERFQH